ncbi:MAG: tRNA glutamyl-Q(34) synthetase GluQRS [Kiritimatiellae bacterium]|nr:tRNA glutamyl-Q(34) synthetase GluQRS [Kiritimatiellia bacterium]
MEEVLACYVGRLAPSPTGALHLGNVRTFLIAYLRARSLGGKVIFRMEDLDHPRDKPGAAAEAREDLRWLGFDWDEYYVQSERKHIYREALAQLPVYPCVCTRRDVERAQSAPHEGDQLYYPGICRGRFASWAEAAKAAGPLRMPCWRFRVEEGTRVEFDDVFAGHYSQDVSVVLGDFPLARDEAGAGYTLAAVVDDLLMGVTEVVRGDDLLPATPAQILVARALKGSVPAYCHVPLVVGPDGRRLAKRHGDTRIGHYRASGVKPEEIIGFLASSCGWCPRGESVAIKELVENFRLDSIPHEPFSCSIQSSNILGG